MDLYIGKCFLEGSFLSGLFWGLDSEIFDRVLENRILWTKKCSEEVTKVI